MNDQHQDANPYEAPQCEARATNASSGQSTPLGVIIGGLGGMKLAAMGLLNLFFGAIAIAGFPTFANMPNSAETTVCLLALAMTIQLTCLFSLIFHVRCIVFPVILWNGLLSVSTTILLSIILYRLDDFRRVYAALQDLSPGTLLSFDRVLFWLAAVLTGTLLATFCLLRQDSRRYLGLLCPSCKSRRLKPSGWRTSPMTCLDCGATWK